MLATTPTIDPTAESGTYSRFTGWDVERDVIRGRSFDFAQKFLPDGLSLVNELEFLDSNERRLLGQIQGRTYAKLFGLFEYLVSAEVRRSRPVPSPSIRGAPKRFVGISAKELDHMEMFRRIDELIAEEFPARYRFMSKTDDVAEFVLARSTWAVRALIYHFDILTHVHYQQSIATDPQLSALYKDVFFFHWKERALRAILDELEWLREDERLNAAERDRSVNDWIELVQGVDALLLFQAPTDVEYFVGASGRTFMAAEVDRLHETVLSAYRWQFLRSGAQDSRFAELLGELVGAHRAARVGTELAPLRQWGAQSVPGASSNGWNRSQPCQRADR